MNTDNKTGNLSFAEPPAFTKEAFDRDQLDRKWAAERLTQKINALAGGCVICLDAPWGEGKTFFVKNWGKMLDEAGVDTIYIDAFERDYVEDPFLVIAAAIRSHLSAKMPDDEAAERFTEAAKRVSLALLPSFTKILVTGMGAVVGAPGLGGVVEGAMNAAADGAESLAERVIESRLQELEEIRASVDQLKAELASYVETLEQPLVIIIDELDRCSPQFAVRLLERIKHYFEMPKIIFVLSTHKVQLQAAINGVYGQIDANAYLHKFVHLTFHLPKRIPERNRRQSDIAIAVRPILTAVCNDPRMVANTAEFMVELATQLGFSIRDAQRAAMAMAFSNVSPKLGSITAYLACLRIAKPEIYRDLKQRHHAGHQASLALMRGLDGLRSSYFGAIISYCHMEALSMPFESDDELQMEKAFKKFQWDFSFHDGQSLLDFCMSGLDLVQS